MRRIRKYKKALYIVCPIIFTGLFALIYFLGVDSIVTKNAQELQAVWTQGNPTIDFGKSDDVSDLPSDGVVTYIKPSVGDYYGQIICDKTDMNAPLYCGDSDEILKKGVGTYAGSGFPGEGTKVLVSAHDTTFFAPLEQVEVGETINVKTVYGNFAYEVYNTKVLDKGDAVVDKDNSTEELIMYTCYPFGKTDIKRDKRYFVYAKKISGPTVE